MLHAIERATRQTIEQMNLPTVDAVNALRIAKFKVRVSETVAKGDTQIFRPVLEQLEAETGMPLIDIAAALASLAQGATPLLLAGKAPGAAADAAPGTGAPAAERRPPVGRPPPRSRGAERAQARPPAGIAVPAAAATRAHAAPSDQPPRSRSAAGPMETFRIEVGLVHGIRPGNIVGAIANEAGIEGVHIGRVDIREEFSFVDLPHGMPKQVFKQLQKVRVAGRELNISKAGEKPPKQARNPAQRHTERTLLSRRTAKR
jgi:ATP-dependent RNA helicase DeaD